MNAKTLLIAKIIVIQQVSAGFNLVPLIATCSQNTLDTCFCPHFANWPKHHVAMQTDYQTRDQSREKVNQRSTFSWICSLILFTPWLHKHLDQSHSRGVRATRVAKTFRHNFLSKPIYLSGCSGLMYFERIFSPSAQSVVPSSGCSEL